VYGGSKQQLSLAAAGTLVQHQRGIRIFNVGRKIQEMYGLGTVKCEVTVP